LGDIELSDIGDIDKSQCHNACERERNTSIVTLWFANVTNITQLYVTQVLPELTRAHASGAWLKSRRAYNVRELSHALWLKSRRGTTGKLAGCEQKLQGGEQKSFLTSVLLGPCPCPICFENYSSHLENCFLTP